MYKIVILILVNLFFGLNTFGQSSIRILGKLQNISGNGIPNTSFKLGEETINTNLNGEIDQFISLQKAKVKTILVEGYIIVEPSSGKHTIQEEYGDNRLIIVVKVNPDIIPILLDGKFKYYDKNNRKEIEDLLIILNKKLSINFLLKKLGNKLIYEDFIRIVKKILKNNAFVSIENIENELEKQYIEISQLKKKEEKEDQEFAVLFDKAKEKLVHFNSDSYQSVLEEYVNKYKKIPRKGKELAQVSYLLSKNSYNNFHYEKSLNQVNNALFFKKNDPEYIILKGDILWQLNHYEEAIKTLQGIDTTNLSSSLKSDLFRELGTFYNISKNPDKAIELYNKSLKVKIKNFGLNHPEISIIYNNLGSVYQLNGDFDQAIKYYDKALTIENNLNSSKAAVSYSNIGQVYSDIGNYEKSVAYSDTALQKLKLANLEDSYTQASIYNNLGLAYFRKMNFNKAIDYYTLALPIFSKVLEAGNLPL